jgi:hypothetical protein
MTHRERAMVGVALLAMSGFALSTPLTGVDLVMPAGGDTLASLTPTFVVRSRDPLPADRPIVLRLQIAFTPGFTGQLVVDTTVTADTASITLTRPLPSGATLFIRAGARTAGGDVLFSSVQERVVPLWLTLISPNDLNGSTLETQRPRFIWSSPPINDPPGPWLYDLQIRNVSSGQILFYSNLSDTSFVPPVGTAGLPLEFNTSYRWSVTARIPSGESVTVPSRSSFVIVNPTVPLATLLYQNFPNPFPTTTSSSTCVWFDLGTPENVHLDVFDLRGRHVVNLIPGTSGVSGYAAGRYGRTSASGTDGGCNGDVQWDGRGRDGAFVPPGVYLLRFRAGRTEMVKKIVFRGHP